MDADAALAWENLIQRLRERTIGEYEILTELAHGGMAAVYLAWHHALHKHVVLKVMSPAVMRTQGMIDRFGSEARTQARLEHPNIATVHGVCLDADVHYIVMQYVPGRSLSEVQRAEKAAGRTLALPVIRSLLCQIGSALLHAHRDGVIHRDVKPGNVMLRANGDAVVTDFGIAKVLDNPSLTMTGTVVGTAPYMSPEQCYAAELTGASDQYSLGVLAYELLTGITPFTGNSFVVMQAHVSETPAPVTSRRADCPAEVEAAVLRMLAKKPGDRFPDIADALEAIGATSAAALPNDPVRRELVRLADAEGVRAGLGDVFRAPSSPTPDGMRPLRPRVPTPAPHSPVSGGRSPVPTTGAISSIRVTAERSELWEGEVLGLVVHMLDRYGNAVSDRPVVWRSRHPHIATVDMQGFVTTRSPGQAVLTATCDGKTATIAVVVAQR
jgi:eukaryotic-like serine/threonine-protein kinase